MGEIHNKSISFRKIFGDAISLYKKYYKEVIFFSILISLYNVVDQEVFAKHLYKDSFIILWSGFFMLSLVITTIFYSAATWYIHNHLSGSDISLSDSFRQSLQRVVPVSVSIVLLGVMLFAGFVAFIIPAIFVLVIFNQAYYFVLLKGAGVKEAFSESRKVTKGNRLKILAIVGFSFLPFILLSMLFGQSYPVLALQLLSVIPTSFEIVLSYVLWLSLTRISLASK